MYGQGWTDTEADLSTASSRPASRQVSSDIRKDLCDIKHSSSLRLKVKSRDSGIFDRTSAQSLADPSTSRPCAYVSVSKRLNLGSYLHHLSPAPQLTPRSLIYEIRKLHIHFKRGNDSIRLKKLIWKFHSILHISTTVHCPGFSQRCILTNDKSAQESACLYALMMHFLGFLMTVH